MQYLRISGEINDEIFGKFVDEFNFLDKREPLTLLLDSEGGNVELSCAMSDMLNKYESDVTIYVVRECSSAAFWLLYNTKAKKEFSVHAYCTVHLTGLLLNSKIIIRNDSWSRFMKNAIGELNKEEMRLFKGMGFSDDEVELIKSGEDIYIGNKRLCEIFCKEGKK